MKLAIFMEEAVVIDNRLFMNEDDEILVTCLVQVIRKSGKSRKQYEAEVKWDRVSEDIRRLIREAINIAFRDEATA